MARNKEGTYIKILEMGARAWPSGSGKGTVWVRRHASARNSHAVAPPTEAIRILPARGVADSAETRRLARRDDNACACGRVGGRVVVIELEAEMIAHHGQAGTL